jgi:predicted nucleic acid-binding protein
VIVVSNASPLIILAKISHFNLPQRLFNKITISEEVWDEVVVKGAGLPGSTETQQASQSGQSEWINIAKLVNSAQLTAWRNKYSLGAGELSTILLAKEVQADVALIDERGARLLAQSEGVPVLGTVGLLELGYRSGGVTDLRLAYQTMLAQGAHIDKQILNQSLAGFNLSPI